MCCCCCCCSDSDEKDVKPSHKTAPQKNAPTATAAISTQPQSSLSKNPATPTPPPTIVTAPIEKNILDTFNLWEKMESWTNELPDNYNLAAVNDKITQSVSAANEKFKKSDHLILTLQRSVEDQKLQRSTDDPELLETQTTLAQALVRRTGCYRDALRLCETVFEAYERSLGPYHLKTMTIHLLYAQTLLHLTEHQEAMESFKKLYEISKTTKTNSNSETEKIQKIRLSSLQGVAACLKMTWEFEEALEILEKVYEEWSQQKNNFDQAMMTRLVMAKVMKCQGRLKESKMVAIKVCQNLQTSLHPDDWRLIFAEHFIGTLVKDEKNFELAFEILIQILAKEVRTFGPYHPLSLSTLLNFGILFEKAGAGKGGMERREEDAASIYFNVWEKRAAIFGHNHPKTVKVRKRLDHLNAAAAAAQIVAHNYS